MLTTRPLKPTITSLTTTQRLKHVPVHLYAIIIKSLRTMVINNCSVTYTTYQGDQDKK